MIYLYEKIEQLTDHQLFLLGENLPQKLKERTWQMKNRKRKEERIIGYHLLCHALLKEYGQSKREISVIEGKYGKLFLAAMPDIFFNISHSDENVACIVGKTENGIDLQKRILFQERIERRICSEQEKRRVDACQTIQEKEWTLTKIWAAKEEYLKKKATGIIQDLRLFRTEEKNDKEYTIEEERIILKERQNFIVAICTAEENQKIFSVTLDQLLKESKENSVKKKDLKK